MEFSIKEIYFFHSSRKCKFQLQNRKKKTKKSRIKQHRKKARKTNSRTTEEPDLLSFPASSSHRHFPTDPKALYIRISQRRGTQGKKLPKKTECISTIRNQRRHSSLWKQTPSFYSGAVSTAGHLSCMAYTIAVTLMLTLS